MIDTLIDNKSRVVFSLLLIFDFFIPKAFYSRSTIIRHVIFPNILYNIMIILRL